MLTETASQPASTANLVGQQQNIKQKQNPTKRRKKKRIKVSKSTQHMGKMCFICFVVFQSITRYRFERTYIYDRKERF